MQKNVGTFDAIMRITCGLTGLAWATACMVRRPYRSMPWFTAIMSGMKVAEGVTRFCPMLKLMNTNTLGKGSASKGEPSATNEQTANQPNPAQPQSP